LDGSGPSKIEALLSTHVNSIEEILARDEKIATLKQITPASLSNARYLLGKRSCALREKAGLILDKAESHLRGYLNAAVVTESAFFAGHNLPHEKTSVSRRIENALNHIPVLREGLQDNPGLHPNSQPVWNLHLPSLIGPLAR